MKRNELNGGIGWPLRSLLVVIALGVLYLATGNASDSARVIPIAAFCLAGAFAGYDPFARFSGPRAPTKFALPHSEQFRPQPLIWLFVGVVSGVIWAAVEQSWWYLFVAGTAGLFVGLSLPLARYRIGATLLVFVVAAGCFSAGMSPNWGLSMALFLGGCAALFYGALIWGTRTDPIARNEARDHGPPNIG